MNGYVGTCVAEVIKPKTIREEIDMPERNERHTTSPGQSRIEPDPRTDQDLEQMAEEARAEGEDVTPPPVEHRPDTMVRATSPEARTEMERGDTTFGNEASFTKGRNAPTTEQTGLPYTVEQMDEQLREAPQGLFPDTPGGAGATPLSSVRETFLEQMHRRGGYSSRGEAETAAQAVFNALRRRAIEIDDPIMAELSGMVRVGEAPEVQVEEMMWGGDSVDRLARLVTLLQNGNQHDFYTQVQQESGKAVDTGWAERAVTSFFAALKHVGGEQVQQGIGHLGELQGVWERA